jgi:hypothetical protein
MARRSPPRKVTYVEPLPPRLARNTIIESTFDVGRRFVSKAFIRSGPIRVGPDIASHGKDAAAQVPKVRMTLSWRGVDSNFRYADVVHLIVAPLRIPRALHRAKKGAPRCGA